MELPGDVARYETALTRARRGIAGHCVNQYANPGGQPGIAALRENSSHCPGEHISGPGARHTRVASLAKGRDPTLRAHDRSRALQHHGAAVSGDQTVQCGQSIRLYLFRADVE